MKKILFASTAVLALTVAHGQTLNWQWARSGVDTGSTETNQIAVDSNSNVYATGYFNSSTITFGNITLTGQSPNSANYFLVKYDAFGNVKWAQGANGLSTNGLGVVTDSKGYIYVCGSFWSPSITFGTTTIMGSGADLFFVKYDSLGNVLWAKNGGSNMTIFEMNIDSNDNLYIVGFLYQNPVIIGTDTLVNDTTDGTYDVLLVKYDSLANPLWGRSGKGKKIDWASSVSADESGNVYITGSYWSPTIKFDTITLTNSNSSGTFPDLFVVKYNSSGKVMWGKTVGNSAGGDNGNGIVSNNNGEIYLTGSFDGSSINFGNVTLTGAGSCATTFTVKYDSIGNTIWGKSPTGFYNNNGFHINLDLNGNVYTTGRFFYSTISGNDTLISAGLSDIFLVKYDSNGNMDWAKSAGGSGWEEPSSICIDKNGFVFVSGFFADSSISFGNIILPNSGHNDCFVAKLSSIVTTVQEDNLLIEINLYPNPTSSQTTLQTDNLLHNATLTVNNCFGQTIAQIKNINGQTVTLHRGNLASGLYFVRLTEENKTIAADKLVIME